MDRNYELRMIKHSKLFQHSIFAAGMLFALSGCGLSTTSQAVQTDATVSPAFQAQMSPIPTPATYRCGAWSSNNAPSPYSTITIYAKLTKNTQGVSGATAQATAHFQDGDLPLDQQATSDQGGYVSFTLPLQGRQPRLVPTTVDVIFTVGSTKIACTPAFFTPE